MRSGSFGVAVAALAIAGGSLACGRPAPVPEPVDTPEAEHQAVESEQPPVQVRTRLNRTAAWVGDPIVWTVELIGAPGIDVIAEDLDAERLELVGLELVGSESEQHTGPDGTVVRRVEYHLRPYEISTPQLRATVPLGVRYYVSRPGQQPADLVPAGEVQVPQALLAWRSTIPEGLSDVRLRQAGVTAEELPLPLRLARPFGIALILMAIVPVVLWGAARIGEAQRPRVRRPSRRALRSELRTALESLRDADTLSEADRREAYGRLSAVLRRHVAETTGLPGFALTSDELARRLEESGVRLPADALREILAECEQACYGPSGVLPAPDRFRDRVAETERLL